MWHPVHSLAGEISVDVDSDSLKPDRDMQATASYRRPLYRSGGETCRNGTDNTSVTKRLLETERSNCVARGRTGNIEWEAPCRDQCSGCREAQYVSTPGIGYTYHWIYAGQSQYVIVIHERNVAIHRTKNTITGMDPMPRLHYSCMIVSRGA